MKESYDERLATYIDPGSCGAARKGGVEALTGERAGQALSRERSQTPGRRRCYLKRKAASGAPISRGAPGPRAVEDPVHARKHLAREPGDPLFAQSSNCPGTHREV
jgi:hypothetical protein